MARVSKAFRVVVAILRILRAGMHYVQRRRRTDAQRPRLRLDFIHPPFWGADALDFAVSNTGGGAARNCRYCRLQEFTMAGPVGRPASFSVSRWYSSNPIQVLPGSRTRASAVLTLSPCPRGILEDVAIPGVDQSSYRDAIVCEDSSGTWYRFRCYLGENMEPDLWNVGLLDRFRGVVRPAWADWAVATGRVDPVRWDDVT